MICCTLAWAAIVKGFDDLKLAVLVDLQVSVVVAGAAAAVVAVVVAAVVIEWNGTRTDNGTEENISAG